MNKNLVFLTVLLCCGARLRAQDLNAYTVDPAGSVSFGGLVRQKVKTEAPPWTLAGGWHSYFFVDGINSYVGSSPLGMISNSLIDMTANGYGPVLATSPDGCTAENMFPWRRNYYGIWSAQNFYAPAAGSVVSMGFVHGENRSFVGTDTDPGNVPCETLDHDHYAAFVCGSWTPYTAASDWGIQYFTDLGPLVWPSTGYQLSNGEKSSLGVGGPSAIQADDGNMYLFYKDMSHYVVSGHPDFPWEDGRHPGIKVARAPISDALNPQAYKSFYQDPAGNQFWNPSLPAGFTKDNTTAFFRTPGPLASNILDDYDYIRFSVAKVAGTNYYFGVGNYSDEADRWTDGNGSHPTLKTALLYSTDLVHWQGKRNIDATHDWTTTHFDYPIFLSSDGSSNTSIDPNDFYVIGTSPSTINSTVYRMHIYIPAPPPPPPPPGCYDAQGNQIICCVDDPANGVYCPQSQKRKLANGMAAGLDASLDAGAGVAPYVFPNPGRGIFQLTYTLKDPASTQLNVVDLTGRVLLSGNTMMRSPGRYTESVNISGRAKGLYMLELLVNGGKKTFKVIYQ
jgi:hypothetical protein